MLWIKEGDGIWRIYGNQLDAAPSYSPYFEAATEKMVEEVQRATMKLV